MEIEFDFRGNLKPYEKTTISLNSFKDYFVDNFREQNGRRIEIFDNYFSFIKAFQQEITENFIH